MKDPPANYFQFVYDCPFCANGQPWMCEVAQFVNGCDDDPDVMAQRRVRGGFVLPCIDICLHSRYPIQFREKVVEVYMEYHNINQMALAYEALGFMQAPVYNR